MQLSTANPRRARAGRSAAARTQSGIGLIEILIAVVLISIGFLAGARMQVEGMRFSQSAYYRSQAYFMANDIIDRMRANLEGVRNGSYDSQTTVATSVKPDCFVTSCDAADIAQRDLAEWSDYIFPSANAIAALPSSDTVTAQGSITRDTNGQYTVSLIWADSDGSDSLDVRFLPQN